MNMKIVCLGLTLLTSISTLCRVPVRGQAIKITQASSSAATAKPTKTVLIKAPDNQMFVRVLLDERAATDGPLWVLSTTGHFLTADGHTPYKYQELLSSAITLSMNNGALTVNGIKTPSHKAYIVSTANAIHHGMYTYNGTFMLVKKGRKVQLINVIELEDYVASGLRWEMLPGWHSAALQAGAIAYRTYVIKSILTGRKKAHAEEYDIRCTPIHQTYKGTHNCPTIHNAVKKTHGTILTYKKEPIDALYDACCGGSIPARREGIDFKKAPYLARAYACTYCKKSKLYTWRLTYSLNELREALTPLVTRKGPLQDIRISDKDKAGAARELKVKIKNQWSTLNAQKIPLVFKNAKSSTFTLKRRGTQVSLEGFGYGHQYGFCQWGAQGMAERNWDCKGILRFYYPGTTVTKYTHHEYKA